MYLGAGGVLLEGGVGSILFGLLANPPFGGVSPALFPELEGEVPRVPAEPGVLMPPPLGGVDCF